MAMRVPCTLDVQFFQSDVGCNETEPENNFTMSLMPPVAGNSTPEAKSRLCHHTVLVEPGAAQNFPQRVYVLHDIP